MMVAYHVGYDVSRVAPSVGIDPFSGGWQALQVACGSSFLFVVGVSLAISNARGRARGLSGWPLYRRHLRRAARSARRPCSSRWSPGSPWATTITCASGSCTASPSRWSSAPSCCRSGR
jgi:hypothetical protein